MVPGKMTLGEMSFKIVLRQKNVRKFKRLFYILGLIPLHTQKDVRRSLHEPIYAKL